METSGTVVKIRLIATCYASFARTLSLFEFSLKGPIEMELNCLLINLTFKSVKS